jgi:hypothetical protein
MAVITNIDRQVNSSSPYFFQGRMINGTFLYGRSIRTARSTLRPSS